MIPEKVLVNLKILSKIQKNGKITKSCDGIISLETFKHLQFIKRTLYGDSRVYALYEINSIINESIHSLNILFDSKILNNKYINSQKYLSLCEDIRLLLTELNSAKNGIANLKFTYIKDLNVNAKLDVYIGRISNVIRDSLVKFSRYSSEPIHFIDDEYLSSLTTTSTTSSVPNYIHPDQYPTPNYIHPDPPPTPNYIHPDQPPTPNYIHPDPYPTPNNVSMPIQIPTKKEIDHSRNSKESLSQFISLTPINTPQNSSISDTSSILSKAEMELQVNNDILI
jgi:hypothetical protein